MKRPEPYLVSFVLAPALGLAAVVISEGWPVVPVPWPPQFVQSGLIAWGWGTTAGKLLAALQFMAICVPPIAITFPVLELLNDSSPRRVREALRRLAISLAVTAPIFSAALLVPQPGIDAYVTGVPLVALVFPDGPSPRVYSGGALLVNLLFFLALVEVRISRYFGRRHSAPAGSGQDETSAGLA